MKRLLHTFLGFILTLPLYAAEVLGLSLYDFREQVLRPINLPAGEQSDTSAESKINSIFEFAINLILYASGSVAVVMLVIGGVRYVMSFGNQEMMDGAKKTIKFALIGLLVVILAFAIVTNVIDIIYRTTV
jgi:hypothetical protein